MASDPNDRPIRWEYDLYLREFTPRTEPRPVPTQGIFDEPSYCIRINEFWLPHVLGGLQVLLEGDSWAGGDDEIWRAQQEIQKLISAIRNTPCEASDMRQIELQTIPIDLLCFQAQWKYTDEDNSAWRDLGDPLCSGADGLTPEFRLTPIDDLCKMIEWKYTTEDEAAWRELGAVCDGANGEDCGCTDPVPPQPVIEPEPETGLDRCQLACNIAFGLGAYFYQKFVDELNWMEATFEAIDIIADLVGNFIEAFPILGAVVDTVVQAVENWKEKDIAALRGENTETFKENMQCKLYEFMADDEGDFTAEYLNGIRNELVNYMLLLPPQGPLLVVIGQAYAASLLLYPTNELLRRANIYKDNEGECDLCDVDCGCTIATYLIDCQEENNNTFIPDDWSICVQISESEHVTQYARTSIDVTLPTTRKIKRIAINYRSADSPNAPITSSTITVNGVDYTQAISGSTSGTTPHIIDDLFVDASVIHFQVGGTVNGSNPNGYFAFYEISVQYCE